MLGSNFDQVAGHPDCGFMYFFLSVFPGKYRITTSVTHYHFIQNLFQLLAGLSYRLSLCRQRYCWRRKMDHRRSAEFSFAKFWVYAELNVSWWSHTVPERCPFCLIQSIA
jgi:hypothetical protein